MLSNKITTLKQAAITSSPNFIKSLSVIPQDILTCETVFYWGSLTAKCVTDHPDIYDQMMPTLTNFSDYLKT